LSKRINIGKKIKDEEIRFIDTAEFWKDQYVKLHLEKTALEGTLCQLEQEHGANFDISGGNALEVNSEHGRKRKHAVDSSSAQQSNDLTQYDEFDIEDAKCKVSQYCRTIGCCSIDFTY